MELVTLGEGGGLKGRPCETLESCERGRGECRTYTVDVVRSKSDVVIK